MVVKRFGVFSVGKIFGSVYFGLGLVFGALFSMLALVGAGIGAASGESEAWLGALFGVGAIILFPLFYGFCGLIAGIVGSALYNLAASLVGGVEVELE